jgi:WD40 repeat protein
MLKHSNFFALIAILAVIVLFTQPRSSLIRATNFINVSHKSFAENCGPMRETISNVVVSYDSKYVIADWTEHSIRIWDLQTRSIISTLTDPVISGNEKFTLSPDNEYIVTGGDKGTVVLWSVASGRKIQTFPRRDDYRIVYLVFSPDSRYILVASDLSASLWNVKTGQRLHEFSVNTLPGAHAEFSPDGKMFIIGDHIWQTQTGQIIDKLDGFVRQQKIPTGEFLLFSPDGKYILVEGDKQDILVDAKNFAQVRTLEGTSSDDDIYAWKFSPDGKYLTASKGQDAALIWDVETGKQIHRFALNYHFPQALFFSDSKQILLLEWARTANDNESTPIQIYTMRYTIYNLATRVEVKKYTFTEDYSPTRTIISPNNKYLITTGDIPPRPVLQIRDIETGTLIGQFC